MSGGLRPLATRHAIFDCVPSVRSRGRVPGDAACASACARKKVAGGTATCPAQAVHFPEVITLRVRDSAVEKPVRIRVWELQIVGSDLICEVHFSTMNIVRWARDTRSGSRQGGQLWELALDELQQAPVRGLERGQARPRAAKFGLSLADADSKEMAC